ncbi:MAG: hypothetical protein ACK4LB_00640 [Spirosomataceae bacterium]
MTSPRVLFLCHEPFSSVGSNGKTYESIFKNFADAEVLTVYVNHGLPSSKKFTNYFRINDFDIIRGFLRFDFSNCGSKVNNQQVSRLEAKPTNKSHLRGEVIKWGRTLLFSLFPLSKATKLHQVIQDFKPTVLFVSGSGGILTYKMLQFIAKKYELPYYIYFTDDYFIHNNGINWLYKALHEYFVSYAKPIVERASGLFVISPKLKQEYSSYFNLPAHVLINAIEKPQTPVEPLEPTQGQPIVFRYFGWLHSHRSSSLKILNTYLQRLIELHQLPIQVEIFSLSVLDEQMKQDLDFPFVSVLNPVMGDEFIQKVNSSHFLIHAESFHAEDMKITMSSISTKIPEYCISGRCIVAVGPSELASIQVIQHHDAGIVINTPQYQIDLQHSLLEVISSKEKYLYFCKNADEAYEIHFNAQHMRQNLRNILSDSSNKQYEK